MGVFLWDVLQTSLSDFPDTGLLQLSILIDSVDCVTDTRHSRTFV